MQQEKKEYKIPTSEESLRWVSWELKTLNKTMASIEAVLSQIKDELKHGMPQIQSERHQISNDLPF